MDLDLVLSYCTKIALCSGLVIYGVINYFGLSKTAGYPSFWNIINITMLEFISVNPKQQINIWEGVGLPAARLNQTAKINKPLCNHYIAQHAPCPCAPGW